MPTPETTGRLRPRHVEVMAFARWLALAVAVVVMLPAWLAWQATPAGGLYLGAQTAVDDHMVYAAWMHQAMEGRFFLENRFTTEPQPGLTVHLYFWALGQLAHAVGIAAASNLARGILSGVLVLLLAQLILRLRTNVFAAKLALGFTVLGGGVGFLAWQTFGIAAHPNRSSVLSTLLAGRLPIDVWQTEGFVLPSMLSNGLFVASLCLMVVTLNAVLDARESWRPVLPGALAFGVLMNIHSYDVLLLTFVLVGFLVAQMAVKGLTAAWVGRGVVIGLGAVPAALWFVHVLRSDTVFQARAATPTYSPPLAGLVIGLLPLVLLAVAGFAHGAHRSRRRLTSSIAVGLALVAVVALFRLPVEGYQVGTVGWIALYGLALGLVALVAREDPGWNLMTSWALVGVVAPLFPALFQRKLTMGIAVPWAILAGLGLAAWMAHRPRERSARNLTAALAIVVVGASSVRWVFREFDLIRTNVANTTVHSLYLGRDVAQILGAVQRLPGRPVVVALPGVANPTEDPDQFRTPYVPDLNPVLAGWAGAVAPAGHWSETPNYGAMRNLATQIFLRETPPATRTELLNRLGARYVVAPIPSAFPQLPLADPLAWGPVLAGGQQFVLVDTQPEKPR